MNKGLEVIEAHELFDVGYDDIDVVVHRQSIVHSMVEFRDGSTIAQLSMPDMRLPIAYALAYPERAPEPFGRIDWANVGSLDFEPPDTEAFGCLGLAFEAGRIGETAPAWLNAANEVAVASFLAGQIGWLTIADVLEAALSRHDGTRADSIEVVLEADRRARVNAAEDVRRRRSRH
jgi:1-deoxy-D-xylulose-5-phosphate reductoisomerase